MPRRPPDPPWTFRRIRDRILGRPWLAWQRIADRVEFERWVRSPAVEATAADAAAAARASRAQPFTLPGYCRVCRTDVAFTVDFTYANKIDGVLLPNWREHLGCPGCGLNGRMRAVVHFLQDILAPRPGAPMYLMEQCTPLFRHLARRYRNLTGSEYLGHRVAPGARNADGIRNESVTALTFADRSFQVVMSLDVLEHVPSFERGLLECRRVLRPGGTLLFSVPFRTDLTENQVRATMDSSGALHHHLAPEYHGDPLNTEGCLAYHTFGWELLDRVRAAGFRSVAGYPAWSPQFGYLDRSLTIFVART